MEKLSFITTLKFVRGQILSWVMPSLKVLPLDVFAYRKVQSLKVSQDGHSETSVCEKDNRLYIAKTLFAYRWTLEYEYLLNQASMYSVLSDIRIKSSTGRDINFPKLKGFFNGTPYVLVREFVSGESIECKALDFQREIFLDSINALRSCMKQISPEIKKCLPRRSNMLMLVTFPVYAGISFLRGRVSFRILIRSIILFVKHSTSISWFNTDYVLTHRDLHPGNILLRDNNITIIDTEEALLTEDGTDMAVSFLRYFDWSDMTPNIEFLKQSISSEEHGKFLILSIFYTLQFMATDTSSEEDLTKKTRDYLTIIIDSIAPSLFG